MPGIAGVISDQPADICLQIVGSMLAAMRHERFYESGTLSAPDMGLYVGLTAHPGSFAAEQFTATRDNDVAVVFAGECCTDGSDRPADLYGQHGDAFVERLNGMFSGVLVDTTQKRALLFNDRYGLERIYVHRGDDGFYFASEAKALLRVLPRSRAWDEEGLAQYLAFGCTPGATTIFHGIQLLTGGSLWSFQKGQTRERQYFRRENWESQPPLTASAFQKEFEETFRSVLPRYTRSASRLGISLTGGLDTRMIMACLPKDESRDHQPVSYTFSGLAEETLDERIAARVAGACGLDHHVLRIGSDFLSGYGDQVDRTVYVTDGYFGALGAHEIYLNRRARQLSPIRLTGNFGSEVFRSVSTFKRIGLCRDLFQPDLAVTIDHAAAAIVPGANHPVTFAAFCDIPWNLFGSLAAGRSQVTFRTPFLDNDLVALACRAPALSRQSALPALRLVNACHPGLSSIPTDRGVLGERRGPGHLWRRLFAEATFKLDYLHKEGLPGWLSPLEWMIGSLSRVRLLGLHKYLPYRLWFRRELAGYVAEVLTDAQTARLPYWNAAFLRTMARDHASGRRNHVREINAVLTLEAVDRLLLRGSPAQTTLA